MIGRRTFHQVPSGQHGVHPAPDLGGEVSGAHLLDEATGALPKVPGGDGAGVDPGPFLEQDEILYVKWLPSEISFDQRNM